MKEHSEDQPEVIDQALEWLETLSHGKGESEAFFNWLTESPRHVEVFIQAMTLEQRIAQVAPEQWAALATTSQNPSAPDELANVVSFNGRMLLPTRSEPKRRWRLAAIAAGVAILGIAGWRLPQLLWGWQDYTTAVGEQRTIQLQDGSVVELNTASHLQVRLSAQVRELRLLDGEALFKVQHDRLHPFRVHTADATIQAVGTEFNVYRRTGATTVSVLEGSVQVAPENYSRPVATAPESHIKAAAATTAPAALSAGEQADIGGDGQVKLHSKINAARVTAWQQRRLIFDEETLAHIAAEFNRYNHRHFHIEDPEVGDRRFSGIFDADDPESLALLLARDGRFAVDRTPNEIAIRTR
jgi:transmembrane sensor